MNRTTKTFALAVLLLVVTYASGALADEGNAILKKVDAAMSAAKDQVATLAMTLKDSDGNTKALEMLLKQKGSDLRLTMFTRPAEVKGVSFLVKSDEEMYLYMPEFGKVRRIASHVKKETFMGTDFSFSDFGTTSYANSYQAKVIKKEENKVNLELLPKDPGDTEYGKLNMLVDTKTFLPLRIQFFDKSKKLWKEMTQGEIEKLSSYWVARAITMRDLKKKHATIMRITDIAFDKGLKDSDFSQRMLKRSR